MFNYECLLLYIKQAPVLFKGIAHSINAANGLVSLNMASVISLLFVNIAKVKSRHMLRLVHACL